MISFASGRVCIEEAPGDGSVGIKGRVSFRDSGKWSAPSGAARVRPLHGVAEAMR
jgi:hypothetical protein